MSGCRRPRRRRRLRRRLLPEGGCQEGGCDQARYGEGRAKKRRHEDRHEAGGSRARHGQEGGAGEEGRVSQTGRHDSGPKRPTGRADPGLGCAVPAGRAGWPTRDSQGIVMARIVSWNVNSLNARQERVQQWLADIAPDVLCMQETKLGDEAFPAMAFAAAGYDSATTGRAALNAWRSSGQTIATWSVASPTRARPGRALITARCGGVAVNGYIPNGRALDDPHYQYQACPPRRRDHSRRRRDRRRRLQHRPADINQSRPKAFVGRPTRAPLSERRCAPRAWAGRRFPAPLPSRTEALLGWTTAARFRKDPGCASTLPSPARRSPPVESGASSTATPVRVSCPATTPRWSSTSPPEHVSNGGRSANPSRSTG